VFSEASKKSRSPSPIARQEISMNSPENTHITTKYLAHSARAGICLATARQKKKKKSSKGTLPKWSVL
jgi:hypothetical protein